MNEQQLHNQLYSHEVKIRYSQQSLGRARAQRSLRHLKEQAALLGALLGLVTYADSIWLRLLFYPDWFSRVVGVLATILSLWQVCWRVAQLFYDIRAAQRQLAHTQQRMARLEETYGKVLKETER